MFTSRFLTRVATVTTILIVTLSSVQPAFAAPPTNDGFGSATVITGLPYTDTIDTSEATSALDDPTTCTNNGSVWYAFTPGTDMAIQADTFGSNYDTVLSAYTGTQGALTQVPGACNDDFNGSASKVVFNATGGTTYYFLIGRCCGTGGSGGGSLTFSVQELLPPPNDDFANATVIPSLPFDDTVDTSGAGIEASEPTPSCAYYGLMNTVWYAFTPATSGSVSASVPNANFTPMLAAYTGSSLAGLSEVACRPYGGLQTFHADAGTTYYLQVGVFYPGQQGSPMQFHLEVTPPPVAGIYFSPSDPSAFDNIQFYDQSYDPGNVGFQSFAWDFGDGATSTDQYPTHKYAKDGDYTIQHTVTTYDGRSASITQVVHVRTHDVSITKVSAPNSANVGQTRAITVSIKNTQYPEMVTIEFYRSVTGGGFDFIGSSTQFVPVRSGNRTTNFSLNYTFSPQDAQIGKVTFKAIVYILNGRDAFPADNQAVSTPPTVVKR